MININTDYVNNNLNNYVPANRTPENGQVKYLVFHYTGNISKTATAIANADYYRSGDTKRVGAHYFVDKDNIVLSTREKDQAGSVGKWKNSVYLTSCRNANSISIEMVPKCMNPQKTNAQLSGRDDDIYFDQGTIDNAIELGKYLIEKYNIPYERVMRHGDVYGKYGVHDDGTLGDINGNYYGYIDDSGRDDPSTYNLTPNMEEYHKFCPLPFFSNIVMKYYGKTGNQLWYTFKNYLFSKDATAPYILTKDIPSPTPTPINYTSWVGEVVRVQKDDYLNVRTQPNASSPLLSEHPHLGNGNLVDVIGEEFAPNERMWYKISIAGKYIGYVNASYIMPTDGDFVGVVHDAYPYLNVRKTPTVEYNNIYNPYPALGNGNRVRVLDRANNNWYRIRIENGSDYHIAYASANYIRGL